MSKDDIVNNLQDAMDSLVKAMAKLERVAGWLPAPQSKLAAEMGEQLNEFRKQLSGIINTSEK